MSDTIDAIQPEATISIEMSRTIGWRLGNFEQLVAGCNTFDSEEICVFQGCCKIRFNFTKWFNNKFSITSIGLSAGAIETKGLGCLKSHFTECHSVIKIYCYILNKNGPTCYQEQPLNDINYCSSSEFDGNYSKVLKGGSLEFRMDLKLATITSSALDQPDTVEIGNILDAECFSDFTIRTDGGQFKVHKAILASKSPKFRAMFSADAHTLEMSVSQLGSCETSVMRKFLRYIYTDELQLDDEGVGIECREIAELWRLANEYQVPCLESICELKLGERFRLGVYVNQIEYIFEMLSFANTNAIEKLKEVILDFIGGYKESIAAWDGIVEFISQHPKLGKNILLALAGTPNYSTNEDVGQQS